METGRRLVDDAGKTMDDIVVSVRRVTDIMTEISAASSEQETGIMQINMAINEMDNVTQQNAALVEEAASASQSLQEQASRLDVVVGIFKLDVAHAGINAAGSRQARPDRGAGTRRLTAA